VIGHGHREVGDEDALAFSKTLYYSLGRGNSLDGSFKAAKLASEPFQLHRSCNPEKFFLPGPDQRQSDSDCNELVRFLKGKGLSAIAPRFSEVMGMDLVEDLKRLQAEDLDYPEFSFLRRWHKQALMELAQKIAAASASLRATEDEAEDEASSGPFIPRKDCKFWLNGHCRFGQNCTFKHDPQKKGTGLGRKQGKILQHLSG
jgi:hypothetical protein